MKTLKIIGIIFFIAGVVIQVVSYLFEGAASPNSFLADPFVWGAIITCLGALLFTIYCLSTAHEKTASQKKSIKNVIVADTNTLPTDRYDVYFGNRLNVIEDAQNLSYTETISEDDRRSQQIHCQLTTPGLWPCE